MGTLDSKITSYPAEMNNNQFKALEVKMNFNLVETELMNLKYVNNVKKGVNLDFQRVSNWCVNGWNSEKILRLSVEYFSGESKKYALQWAFPQAYYSAYALTSGFFATTGQKRNTHASSIKYLGELMSAGKYPKSVSFLAGGGYQNIGRK